MSDCKRCGWCCTNVNINIAFSDILRWAKEQRFDILCAVSYVDHGDSRRKGFYITDTVTAPETRCPFFRRGVCSIYDIRPRACAEWPQSLTDMQCEQIECSALAEQRIPDDENFELRKWQSFDFVVAETRKDEVIAILARAREVMALSEEIFQFGLDPTESLDVDGFDNSRAAWTTVGGSPYLDAQDQPANYVWTTTKKSQSGDYSFEDTARPATDTLIGVDLYVYGQTASPGDTIYLWDGGWNDSGIGALPGAWGWINVAVDALLNTWTKVDGALMYIAHPNSANRSDVDAAYLLVEYTPVHLGVAALSGTGSLTAIGNVVGGVVTGVAALSGTGALAAIGDVTAFGVAALSGTGALTAIGVVTTSGVAVLSGTGALSTIGNVIKPGVAALSGTGALSAVGSVTTVGVAALSGTGSLSAIGEITAYGIAALSGTGSLSATGTTVTSGVAALSGTGSLSAVGDVTKYGVAALSGTGSLSAIGTVAGEVQGVAALSGTGTLSAVGLLEAKGAAALAGTGDLSAQGLVLTQGAAALIGTGDLSAQGLQVAPGVAAFSGTGDLSAQGLQIAVGVAALSGTGDLSAIGNVISGAVQGVAQLSGTGSLSATCSILAMGIAILVGSGALTASGDIVPAVTPVVGVDATHRIWNIDNKPKRVRAGRGGFAVWKTLG